MSITQPAASFGALARRLDLGEHVADPAGDQPLRRRCRGWPPHQICQSSRPSSSIAAVEHHHDVVLPGVDAPRAAGARW